MGAYSRVYLQGLMDHPLILWYTKAEIETRRRRSQQWNGNFWTNDYAAMARKTVVRGHLGGGEVPQTNELAIAIESEVASEEIEPADVVGVRTEDATGVDLLSQAVTNGNPAEVGRKRRDPQGEAEDAARHDENATLFDDHPTGSGTP